MSQQSRKKIDLLSWIAGAAIIILVGAMSLNIFLQARRSVRAEGDEWKRRRLDEFPGLDEAAKLAPRSRDAVLAKANEEPCPCRCGYTVAACLHDDADCPEKSDNLARVRDYARSTGKGG